MSVTVLKGNIVSVPALGTLDIVEQGALVLEDGVIAGIFSILPERYAGAPVEDYGDRLILQSFADLHMVLGLTRASVAKSRTDGSRSPGGNAPETIPTVICAVSWE